VKFWAKSKTLWVGSAGFLVNAADLAQQFLNSQAMDTVCAKRAAISSALSAAVVWLRFNTSESLYVRKKK
jgi:hypothetical protein